MDRIWIWFSDNGNIRKWQREPFEEGTEFVASLPPVDAEPVAWWVHDFHIARQPVKARGKFSEPTEYLYPASRENDAKGAARTLGAECEPLYPAAAITALQGERDGFRQMCRENYEAFSAMRNDVNEIIGDMRSQEATLLDGPEMAHECAAVVDAVRDFSAEVARLKDKLAEANRVIERLESYIRSPVRMSNDEDEQARRDGLVAEARSFRDGQKTGEKG